MVQSITFCVGCNEKFDRDAESGACPNCGLELGSISSASTADLEDLLARETYLGHPNERQIVDRDLIGELVGDYEIREFIGRGGMARVYRAYHRSLRRTCAVKILSGALIQRNRDYIELFFNEARQAAALVHPNVVTVHNIGVDDPHHYIEMEFVDGESLQCSIDTHGAMEPLRALNFMIQVCRALSSAHDMGMLHRDLKPSNILVGTDDTAKLADFGLAKRVVADEGIHSGGGMVGTPYFMAPELFREQPASPASDIYAVGVTFYNLLAGRVPFVSGSVVELAEMHAERPVPDFGNNGSSVPAAVEAIVRRCLSKNEHDRYENARALYEDLFSAFGGLRDMRSLLREALDGLDLAWSKRADGYEVVVNLPNGRTQRVLVETTAAESIQDGLVKVYSVAAPLDEQYFRRALELNARIPHSSIGVQEIDGSPHFIMVHSYPRATCDPSELRQTVQSVARWGDWIEAHLTGQDRH